MRCSPPPLAPASFSAAVASCEATSPAWAPPMPSAMAKSGGSMTYASSLCRRVRPGSVTAPTRPIIGSSRDGDPGGTSRFPQTPSTGPLRGRTLRVSRLIPQVGLADADDVPRREPPGAIEPRAVQVGAVRRAEILHPHTVVARLEPRMPRGRVFVGADRDVVLPAAPDRQLRRVQLEVLSLVEDRALDDDQPARDPAAPPRLHAGLARRREDEALLRHPQVTARRPYDPPDEEVEQDEERDLEDEQDLIDGGGVEEHRLLRFASEAQLGGSERDRVAALQLRALHALAVDLQPVGRTEVDDPVRRALLAELGMAPRHVRIG